mgnify:CR=1 FL=1
MGTETERGDVFQTLSTLTVTREGNYTCVAENVAGEDRVTIDTTHMPSSGMRFHVQSQVKPVHFVICLFSIFLR